MVIDFALDTQDENVNFLDRTEVQTGIRVKRSVCQNQLFNFRAVNLIANYHQTLTGKTWSTEGFCFSVSTVYLHKK